MWCLATHLPLLIADLIPGENAHWILFLQLLEITQICFSPTISKDQVAFLQIMICDHHHEFRRLYVECSIIPKMHFMIHMPTMILRYSNILTIIQEKLILVQIKKTAFIICLDPTMILRYSNVLTIIFRIHTYILGENVRLSTPSDSTS
jgi:hypothetical protein